MNRNDLIQNTIISSPSPPSMIIASSSSSRVGDFFDSSPSTLSFDDSSSLSSLSVLSTVTQLTNTNTTDLETGWASSEPLLIPVTILYILILLTGVVGNVATCIVIARNKYMRTATNYYLASLAISDLLLLICGLPQELYLLWRRRPYIFGEFFCIIRGLSSETSSNASVLTITAFTIERYLAICHPLKAHTMSKLSRVVKLIIIIWICALLGAIPLALQFGLKYDETIIQEGSMSSLSSAIAIESTAECTVISPIKHSFAISTFIFFVIPCILLTVLYLSIGLHLRQSEALKRNQPDKCCNWLNKCRPELYKTNSHSTNIDSVTTPIKLHSSSVHSTNTNDHHGDETNNSLLTKYHTSLLTKSSSIYSKFKPSLSCIRYHNHESRSTRHQQLNQSNHHNHNHHHQFNNNHHHHYHHHESNVSSSSRRAVIKMLVAVVVAFFMCWAPFHAQRLMATYASGSTQAEIIIYNLLTYISGVTYYLSTTINPVLYSIMSIKFRSAFKETLGSCCRKTASEPDLDCRNGSDNHSNIQQDLTPVHNC
ncbi:pyrokinin-1 receptor-like isoform X2 [Panonychus citri]|uniref:pyrokinin-1 receptor-like isoform X2 n=1 Tax=Panonychus citri TaxID=50023 RepID=UPI0023070A07|nr:pyrokinin-1 receptor-like isoform X2 [Panonychus citri]